MYVSIGWSELGFELCVPKCYGYQITENIRDPKIIFENILEAVKGYSRSIVDKNNVQHIHIDNSKQCGNIIVMW